MNIQSIFTTEAERKEAEAHFISLRQSDDWKFMIDRVLKVWIDEFTENILNPDYQWKEDELKEAKYNRKHWIELSKLPEQLLATLVEPVPEKQKSDDPYFNTVKELGGLTK
jgi:hypothetical protein